MSEHLKRAKALRADETRHYNCCQATLLPFCRELGVDEETAYRQANFFNAGMRCGEMCGAVCGGLMVLGLAGSSQAAGPELIRRFREKNGCTACGELLAKAKAAGEEKKPHCDRLVCEAVELVEELLREQG